MNSRLPGNRRGDLRHEEDFAGIGVFHLLSGGVAIHVDVAATRIEWTENIPWFPRHRFRSRILDRLGGLSPGRCRRRRFRLFRSRDTRAGSGSCIRTRLGLRRYLSLGGAIRRCDGAARRSHRVGRNRGAGGGGLRFRPPIDSIANVVGRGIDHAKRSDRHIMRRPATAEHDRTEDKNPASRFHAGNLSGIELAAREFLHSQQSFTSLMKSLISCFVADHEHINR